MCVCVFWMNGAIKHMPGQMFASFLDEAVWCCQTLSLQVLRSGALRAQPEYWHTHTHTHTHTNTHTHTHTHTLECKCQTLSRHIHTNIYRKHTVLQIDNMQRQMKRGDRRKKKEENTQLLSTTQGLWIPVSVSCSVRMPQAPSSARIHSVPVKVTVPTLTIPVELD